MKLKNGGMDSFTSKFYFVPEQARSYFVIINDAWIHI